MTAPNLNLDPELLGILVCPKCRSEFRVDDEASELVCTNEGCALAYPVRDGIPVLLIDEARETRGEAGNVPGKSAGDRAGEATGGGTGESADGGTGEGAGA